MVLTVSILTAACNPFQSRFVSACEEALKERLRSPSQYERVEIRESHESIPVEDYIKAERKDLVKTEIDALREGRYKPTKHTAFMEYDAPNAYGTPVRGLSLCEYTTRNENPGNVSAFFVEIDGQTNQDRLIEALKSGN